MSAEMTDNNEGHSGASPLESIHVNQARETHVSFQPSDQPSWISLQSLEGSTSRTQRQKSILLSKHWGGTETHILFLETC